MARRRLLLLLVYPLAEVAGIIAYWWISTQGFAADASIYARAWDGGLYDLGVTVGQPAFLYSPVFAQVIWPLTLAGPEPFVALFMVTAALAYAWLLWPLPRRWWVFGMALAIVPVWIANIEWLIALAVVAAVRRPAAWAVVLLTKPTMGVGLLWHVARWEWRPVALAVGTAAAAAAVSFAVAPGLWADWLAVLWNNRGAGYVWPLWLPQIPAIARIGAGAVIIVWGARTGRPWMLPAGLVLAQPDWHPWTLGILAAVPRLYGQGIVARPICAASPVEPPLIAEPA